MFHRINFPYVVALAALGALVAGVASGATGDFLRLGSVNSASRVTGVENTGNGPAIAFKVQPGQAPFTLRRWDGMNHGFLFWVGVVDGAGVAMDEACAWLKDIFARA